MLQRLRVSWPSSGHGRRQHQVRARLVLPKVALMGIRGCIPHRDYGKAHKGFWGYSHFQSDPDEDVYSIVRGRSFGSKASSGRVASGTIRPTPPIAGFARCVLGAPRTRPAGGFFAASISPTMPGTTGFRLVLMDCGPVSGARPPRKPHLVPPRRGTASTMPGTVAWASDLAGPYLRPQPTA